MFELRDERGHLLHGNNSTAPYFGIPYVEGDLVQVMQCDDGIVPPNTDGTSHAQTPLLFTTRIGNGMSPVFAQPAKFSDAVIPRPVGAIFIRVFNAPTLAEATFYVDSHVHTVRDHNNDVFRIEAHRTVHPIDPGDDDNDGLNNSWELSYGTDLNDEDSDDDGIMDGLEHLSRLDPTDADSNLALSGLFCREQVLCLEWTSVVGANYRVEALSPASGDYTTLATDIEATNQLTQVDIAMDADTALACYRVMRNDQP